MSFNNKHWILGLICLSLNFSAVAQGDAEIGKLKTMGCMGCHGPTGNSFLPNFPALAGQPAGYIVKQIQDFKAGAFYESQVKTPVIKNIPHLKTEAEKTALLTLGKKLYDHGNADTGQAACFVCHGKNGDALVDLDVPILANQHPQYLISTLKEFKNRKRTNDNERVMRRIVDTMSAEEIEAVAYYSSYLVPTLEEKK